MCHWEVIPVITFILLIFHTCIMYLKVILFKQAELYLWWWSPFHSEFVEDFWSELPLWGQDRFGGRGCWDRIWDRCAGVLLCEGLPLIAVVHTHLSEEGNDEMKICNMSFLTNGLKDTIQCSFDFTFGFPWKITFPGLILALLKHDKALITLENLGSLLPSLKKKNEKRKQSHATELNLENQSYCINADPGQWYHTQHLSTNGTLCFIPNFVDTKTK